MWFRPPDKGADVEAGSTAATGGVRPLYPVMLEPPELRWAFIRKIYSILSIQMLITVAVATVVVKVRHVNNFFAYNGAGLGVYILLIAIPLAVLIPLYYYYDYYPLNLVLLGIFTTCIGCVVGVTCAFTRGRVILESAVLTAVVVISLTLYTFWAAKRGYDFTFLGPFLFAGIIILIVFALVQLLFPMGRISGAIFGGLASLVFSGYIIYDANKLIKRHTYDEYVWAAVVLYLDIINLFLALLTLFSATDV